MTTASLAILITPLRSNMSTIIVKQESIDGGISPTYFGDTKRNQYRIGLGIDPDITMISGVSTSAYKMSNCVMPVGYTKFSSTEVDAYPIKWITPPASTEYVYCVLSNGKLVRYTSVLGTPTTIGTVTGNVANGAEYYNDYIYITTGTDVSRYGPLSGAAALTNTVWTGATLGALTALGNAVTYPTINGVPIPKHWMHSHVDGQLYLLDFIQGAGASGQGIVNVIRTTTTGTNNGSAYNVLDLLLVIIQPQLQITAQTSQLPRFRRQVRPLDRVMRPYSFGIPSVRRFISRSRFLMYSLQLS